MGTPAVIFKNEFLYEWHVGDLDYSDYINRESAQVPLLPLSSKSDEDDTLAQVSFFEPDDVFAAKVPVLKPESSNSSNDYYGYMSRSQAQDSNAPDKSTEYTTIFDAENDFLTKAQINHYRELEIQSQKEGCPKYIPVMSFDNNFLINNRLMNNGRVDVQKIKEISRKAMNSLISASDKLDARNVYWTANLHVNTDNIHVHFSLLEYHRLVDRKKVYSRNGMDMIEIKAFEKFKSTVANSIILEKRTPELTKFKRENLIPDFASSIAASEELLRLMKKLPPPKPKVGWQYSRKEMLPFHEEINSCIDKIILSNENVRRQFNHYKNSLQALNNQYNEFYGERVDPDVLTYTENQMNDFYCRAGNKLLQALMDMRENNDFAAYGVSKKGEKEKYLRAKSMEKENKIPDAIKYLEAQRSLSPYLTLTLGRLCLCSPESEQKGIKVLTSLSENKDNSIDHKIVTSANAILGYWYLKKEKKEDAEKYLKKAAESNDIRSQFQLSKLYSFSENSNKSLYWLTRSADNGYAPAQSSLGLIYIRSDETDKGLHYLNHAARQGDIFAKRYIERLQNNSSGETEKEKNKLSQPKLNQPKLALRKTYKNYHVRRSHCAAKHQIAVCWSTLRRLLEEYERHIRELQEEFNEMNNVADNEYGFDYEYTM